MLHNTHNTANEILTALLELGLTGIEAQTYLTAVRLGAATTTEIASAAAKERSNTHHTLRRLEQLGLVETTLDSPTKFRSMEVGDAIDHLFSLQSMRFRKLDKMRKSAKTSLTTSGLVAPQSAETYSVIKGRVRTYLRMIESMSTCEKEVSLLLSAQGLTRLRRFRDFFKVMEIKANKGVKFRIATEIGKSNIDDVRAFAKICELRHIRNQSTNASIYDGKVGSVALLINEGLEEDVLEHVALWTNGQSFVKMLTDFFNSVWFFAAPATPTIKSMGLKP